MSRVPTGKSTRRVQLASLVALAATGTVVSVGQVWEERTGDRPPSLLAGGGAAALLAFGNLALVVAAVVTARRAPVLGRRWARRLGRHVATACAASLVVALCEHAAHALVPWVGAGFTRATALQHTVGYSVVAALAHVWVLARRLGRVHAMRARLARGLIHARHEQAAAELRAAKAELHPVLVTRALETAAALVATDPAAAERVVIELGRLMREAVTAAGVDEVTLGEECDAACDRASDAGRSDAGRWDAGRGLTVAIDDAPRDLLVPHLVVPALVACADEAGWSGRALVLRAGVGGGDGRAPSLCLTLTGPAADTSAPGAAPPDAAAARPSPPGSATSVLRRRLERQYGARASLSVSDAGSGGAQPAVRLTIPAVDEHVADGPGAASMWDELRRDDERAIEALSVGGAPSATRAPRVPLDATLVGVTVAMLVALQAQHIVAAKPGVGVGELALTLALYTAMLGASAAIAVAVTRRYPIRGDAGTYRALRAQLAAAAVVAAADAAMHAAMHAAGAAHGPPARLAGLGLATVFVLAGLIKFGTFTGIAHMAVFGRERERSVAHIVGLRTARATRRRGSADCELRALKAELNPHFVGNALHTVATLIRRNPALAVQALHALRDLADAAGKRVDTQEVSLGEEMRGLEPFLALEHARLGACGGTLGVRWDVTPDGLHAAVPHLLLQPLVENAVRHGLAPRGGAGQIVITARRVGPKLVLTVADDGVGLGAPPGAASTTAAMIANAAGVGAGAGLSGIRRRLALLYGDAATVALDAVASGGTTARVTLPYRWLAALDGAATLTAAGG